MTQILRNFLNIFVKKAGDTMTGNLSFSGAQALIGGSGTTDPLNLQSTSGVGTTGADINLNVGNNGATKAMVVYNNGNVGIGTSSPPTQNLYINKTSTGVGEFRIQSLDASASYSSFTLQPGSNGSLTGGAIMTGVNFSLVPGFDSQYILLSGSAATKGINVITQASGAPIKFTTGGLSTAKERMRIIDTGVGVMTTTPDLAFTVNGDMDVRDIDAATKAYRFRALNSGALDFEGGGADLYISAWSNPDFTGTQYQKMVLDHSDNITQAINVWNWKSTAGGTTYAQIDGSTGIVKVRLGTSGNLVKVGGTVVDNITDVGNTHTDGSTFDSLYTDTMVGNTFTNAGDKVSARFSGIFASSATATRDIRLVFAGTTILDTSTLTTATAQSWDITVLIIADSSSSVKCVASIVSSTGVGAGAFTDTTYTRITGLTFTNAYDLILKAVSGGTGAAASDIVAKMGTVSFNPAA